MAVNVWKRPDYLDWIDGTGECTDNWNYRKFDEYPPGDSDEKTIIAFMEDAKEAEKAILEDLIGEGMNYSDAKEASCQWPLRDDAPIEIIREYIGYQHEIQELARKGKDV